MILARLRRSRFLCASLLVASPAALGTLLPVIHPCPVDAPWLAQGPSSRHPPHHALHHEAPATGAHHETCHCIGSCVPAAVPARAAAPIASTAVLLPSRLGWHSHDASLRLAPVATLLPPSTAPPLV